MQHSQAAHAFAVHALESGTRRIIFDLSHCDYMDSTFLGCLIDLHQQFTGSVVLAASRQQVDKLLGVTHLDRILKIIPAPPACYGEPIPLPGERIQPDDLARHVATCHRRLAEIESPLQPVFARIADQLEREQS